MTGFALPIDASAGAPSFSGRQHRNGMAAFSAWDGVPLAGRSGIRPMGGTAANIVTLSGTTITIGTHVGTVSPGWSTLTGLYQVALTVAETKTLTAQGANPRKDIVVGRVYDDAEFTSGLRTYQSEYIAGTPAPSPIEPSVPTGAIKLAVIDVPASGGGSPVVTQTYPYTAAAGGMLVVRTQAERDALSNPYSGQQVWRVDRKWVERHDGTAWRVQGVGICSSGTDRDSAVTNPVAGQLVFLTNVALIYRYSGSAWIRTPHEEFGSVNLNVTAGGSGSSGVTFATAFAAAPHVNLTSSSGRYNLAVSSITTTGFTLGVNNWTAAGPGVAVPVYWHAVEKT